MAGTNTNRPTSRPPSEQTAAGEPSDEKDATRIRMEGQSANEAGAPRPTAVQEHLGRQLRAAYSALVNEPIPEKLAGLLRKLEKKQKDLE